MYRKIVIFKDTSLNPNKFYKRVSYIKKIYLFFFISFKLFRETKKYDLVIYYGNLSILFSFLSQIISFVFYKKYPKLILSVHNSYSFFYFFNKNKFKKFIFNIFIKFCFLKYDYVVSSSKGLAEELKNKFYIDNDKLKIIYPPIDFEELSQKGKINLEKRCRLEFNDKKRKIISIGRLTHQKDFYTLIKAVNLLIKESFFVYLYIIGGGYLYNDIIKLINKYKLNEYVFLLGPKENPYPYLKRADLYVQSSITEGFCIALVEALFFNKPVIASDCNFGPSEILHNGKYGFLFSPGDYKHLAFLIKSFFVNYKNKENYKSRALFFDGRNSIKKYLKLIIECVN